MDTEIKELDYNYKLIAREIPEIGNTFSQEEFISAYMLVYSRNFRLPMKGTITNIDVPLADMFNTEHPENAKWYYDDSRNGFIVEAYTDIKKNQ